MFCSKDVLRNFAKSTGKHLCQSLFFNKVASLRPATLLKKRLWHRRFPVNFAKFLRATFFTEHLWWLPLALVTEFFNCYEYFLRLSGFTDLFGKVFPINVKFMKFCEIRGSIVNRKTKQVLGEI